MAQVHPIPNTESQNPQEIIGARGEGEIGSGMHRHSSPAAFVVEMFLRENPNVQTTQPGRELESTDEDICRICHDTKDKEELVRVCRCNGSAKYAHKSCVLRWFQVSYRYECELCHYKMKIKKDGFKPVRERLIYLVSFAVVQSVSVSVICGFPRPVLCPCLTRDRLGADNHDSGDEQVLQFGLHLPDNVLFCKYVLNVNETVEKRELYEVELT
ncbi:E3 ubiquitin-protein ligase MARCHF2-like [Oculina patagonica]